MTTAKMSKTMDAFIFVRIERCECCGGGINTECTFWNITDAAELRHFIYIGAFHTLDAAAFAKRID